MAEPKNCPFCGQSARIIEQEIGDCNPTTFYGVTCDTEGCWTYEGADPWEDTPEDAIERWNRREVKLLDAVRWYKECWEMHQWSYDAPYFERKQDRHLISGYVYENRLDETGDALRCAESRLRELAGGNF